MTPLWNWEWDDSPPKSHSLTCVMGLRNEIWVLQEGGRGKSMHEVFKVNIRKKNLVEMILNAVKNAAWEDMESLSSKL